LAHRVRATFDVLNIQGGKYINAGVEQFLNVLPSFRVA
jgi:hypothetical protein